MHQVDRDKFFNGYRQQFGRLIQGQVDNLNFLLSSMEADQAINDYRWAAYMLATMKRETGDTFGPVTENLNYSAGALVKTWPARISPEKADELARRPEAIANFVYASRNGNGPEASGDGWRYRGRGFVQITGRGNYRALGNVIGVDLEADPELACTPRNAYAIMSYGMTKGFFTGRYLGYYINGGSKNYLMARKIINGMDHAEEIAGNAEQFEKILAEAMI